MNGERWYVGSPWDSVPPLRVSVRQAHDGKKRSDGSRSRIAPRLRVRCGCCKQALEICYDENPTGDPSIDTLEINGVYGTVEQWQEVFRPWFNPQRPNGADDLNQGFIAECENASFEDSPVDEEPKS